ncbi:hypothetical protein Tco_1033046 [Tanacetum coccineum]|uniref:Uncharacterized protein n=1 Tax=Tanacetum coccineum TaxID=301880 RepID=A0ABQ5GDJ0_9ASTR
MDLRFQVVLSRFLFFCSKSENFFSRAVTRSANSFQGLDPVGDGESRTTLADVSSYGCAEGLVDASSVAGIRLWNINWSVGVVEWPLQQVLKSPHLQHMHDPLHETIPDSSEWLVRHYILHLHLKVRVQVQVELVLYQVHQPAGKSSSRFGLGGLAVEGLDGFSLACLGFDAGAGLLDFFVANFDLGCLALAVFFFPSFSDTTF